MSIPTALIRAQCLPEPLIKFADNGLHVDPKGGIARYGPNSFNTKRHPAGVRVGFIGNAETIESSRNWLSSSALGVKGDAKHPAFPGCRVDRGFFTELHYDDHWNQTITQSELTQLLKIKDGAERFEFCLRLFERKVRLLADLDLSPNYIIICIPSVIKRSCGIVDYVNPQLGGVHRDLHRALKARLMRFRIPTQFLRQATAEGKDPDNPSKIAWNFFTSLYFKSGGIPWAPVGLRPGTCFIGVAFYRPLGTKSNRVQTSLVQAFDEHGEGLILRGHDFVWDEEKEGTKSPHLTAESANTLVRSVLERYRQEMHQNPNRVVVHKRSTFWPGEKEGFQSALVGSVSSFDLVALEPQSTTRLITVNKYPPLRGTAFTVGDLDFLYTTGFISALNEFHSLHVPAPLRISDHLGQDTSREDLLKEILALTKLNFNSARLGLLLPVTLKFAGLVGDILKEVPNDIEPLPQFKFYM